MADIGTKVTIESDGAAAYVVSPAGTTIALFAGATRFIDAVTYCEQMGMEIDWPEAEGESEAEPVDYYRAGWEWE